MMEQRKAAVRLQRAIRREQLISVMNDTKWRAALAVLRELQELRRVPIEFRVKTVRDAAPPTDKWERSFPWHVPLWEAIEWLDINAIRRYQRGHLVDADKVDFTAQITQALRSVHVPFSYEGTAIRIWGSTRPGEAPTFDWQLVEVRSTCRCGRAVLITTSAGDPRCG